MDNLWHLSRIERTLGRVLASIVLLCCIAIPSISLAAFIAEVGAFELWFNPLYAVLWLVPVLLSSVLLFQMVVER